MNQPEYDVAIVGAGFAGLYLLHQCRELGLSARAWEAGTGVGGTWYWNRYPGARCDVESVQYSYQFDDALQQEWDWSERYAPQPEILRYAEHVAERFSLYDDIEFNRRVAAANFDEQSALWTLHAEDGDTVTARFCIMATGSLSVPNWPDVRGRDDFNGELHHTALWPHDGVDFRDKRVAVVGTGSSAIQSIPMIAKDAASVTVFQRTPNYSVPAHNHPMDPDYAAKIKANYADLRARQGETFNNIAGEHAKRSAMSVDEAERIAEYERRWREGGLLFLASFDDILMDEAANDTMKSFVHDKIRSVVNDPDVAELLCPDNIIGGKRLCVDTDYFATYNRDNVSLVDLRQHPIDRINSKGIEVGGQQYNVDVIVFATGFDAMTGALTRIDIRGRGGALLRERWKDGPSTYLGIAMNDFPNLFTVNGPGSPSVLTNMLPSIEQHVQWITACIAYARDAGHNIVEPTAQAESEWWAHVQDTAGRGLKSSADSWYVGANIAGKARVFLPYYGGFPEYRRRCDEIAKNGYSGFAMSG